MSWLASVVAAIFVSLSEKLAAYFGQLVKQKQDQAQTVAQSQASVEPLKKAQTSQEIDDAADDALNNL